MVLLSRAYKKEKMDMLILIVGIAFGMVCGRGVYQNLWWACPKLENQDQDVYICKMDATFIEATGSFAFSACSETVPDQFMVVIKGWKKS